jgi:hypothetical protein
MESRHIVCVAADAKQTMRNIIGAIQYARNDITNTRASDFGAAKKAIANALGCRSIRNEPAFRWRRWSVRYEWH